MKDLTIRNLSKTYFDPYAGTNVTAVHDVSLNVQHRRVRLASSGLRVAAKTTILNMIAGFIPHTGGEILVDGRPVKGPGPIAAWCSNLSRCSLANRARECRLRPEDARRRQGGAREDRA